MATIQERLNRMKQDGQTASVQQRLDQMKQDGQAGQTQKAPAVTPGQGSEPSLQAGGSPHQSTEGVDFRGQLTPRPFVQTSSPAPSLPSISKPKTAQEVRGEMEQMLSSSAKRRTSQDIRAEMDGLDSVIGEMKKQRDVLKSQAGQVSSRGGQGAGDYWTQLNSQAQELEKQIAQLESDRAGLQSQWNQADQIEFDLKMISDKDARAAVDKAMGSDYGWGTVDSRKPAHRDVGYAMTYFQAKARGDERLAASAMENADMALDRMSESQRSRLAWYVGTGDYDGAADYLNRIAPGLNQAEAKDVEQALSGWAQEHPIQGAAVNITSWPFNIPAYFSNAGQAVKNTVTGKKEQNPHLSANVGTRIGTGTSQGTQQAAREAATETFGSETAGDVASFLVGTGLSIGQNVSQIALLGPGSLAAMGFSAAGSATQDVLDRGGTPQQAFLVGSSAGAIEVITEKIPLDNIFRLAREGGGKGLKSVVIEALKEMGTEATEEMISEIANNLVDAAVMGDSSEFQMYVRELQASGLSKEEAEQAAFRQFYIANVLSAGAGGALSGGVMSGGAMAFHQAGQYAAQLSGDTQSAQRTADAIDRAYQAMAEKGMFSPEAGQAADTAREARGQDSPLLANGETLRDARAKNDFYLPTGREGVTFLPGGEGILVDADRLAQGNDTSTLPGREDAVQRPQRAAEGQVEGREAAGPSLQAGENPRPSVQTPQTAEQSAQAADAQRIQDIQDTRRMLRESYARGEMTEEEFDRALDAIMEQEGLAGLSMLDGPAYRAAAPTMEGEMKHGTNGFEPAAAPAGQQLSDGRAGRTIDESTAGQTGSLAEGGSRGPADTGRAAVERQNAGRALRLEAVSSRELGLEGGTDARTVRVLPEGAWDGQLRQTARRVRQETGLGVRFVLGGIQVTGSDGAVHQVRGVCGPDGIMIQADHLRVSPEQIAEHEIFHSYAQQDPGLVRAVEDAIVERYGQAEMDRIMDEYIKNLRGIVDVPEEGADIEFEQAYADIKSEIFADAFAGINAFGTHAEQYQDTVLDTLEGRGVTDTAPGREYAGAVEQRTGPPSAQERFSLEEFPDGQRFVDLNTDQGLFDGLSDREKTDLAVKIIRERFAGKIIGNSNPAFVNSASAREFGHPVKNIDSETRDAKMRTAPELDHLMDAGFNHRAGQDGQDGHVHPQATGGFEYYDVIFKVGDDYFQGVINLEVNNRGRRLKDVTKIRNVTQDIYGSYGPVFLGDASLGSIAPAPSLASSHSENGDAQNRMLTGASAKTDADNITKPHEGTGDSRSAPVSEHSIAQSEAAVKDSGVMLPTGEQGTVMAPRADDFGPTRFSVDENEAVLDGLKLPTLAEVEARKSRENAEGVPDSGTSGQNQAEQGGNVAVESLPAKARDYLQKTERRLADKIGKLLGVPKSAQRAFLQDIVREASTECLNTGKVSQETLDRLFEQAYEQGVQVDREYYDQYKYVRDYLRTTPITVSEQVRGDITDYGAWRKGAFGTLRLVNHGGLGIDTAYMELQDMAPGLFPGDVSHPADQLRQILETAQGIRVAERSLDEAYGPDAAEFKRWSRRDFDEAVDNALRDLKQVKRYVDERATARQASLTPTTTQEVAALWKQVKGAYRTYERAAARNLLTQHDEIQVGRLLRGELELEHLDPAKDNVKGITAVYEAKLEYEELAGRIREWNNQRKAALREQADGFLETANQWKDKKAGILYSRETMERNIRDIVPDAELAEQINQAYFQPVHRAAAEANRAKNTYRDRVRDLGLSRKVDKAKGNTVSEAHAVQLLGEAEDNIQMLQDSRGRMKERGGKTLQEWQAVVGKLWEENPGLDQEKIRGAVKEFRAIYDELFQQMNETRVRNGYEPVNYRHGYFPHFQPGGEGMMALFGRALGIDTAVTSLPTTINGLTHTFKPGIQWFGNAQERLGFNTVYDAVEGFDRYIEGAADVIYQTDNIQRLRALGGQARYRTGDEGLRAQVDRVRANPNLTEAQKQNEIDKINSEGKFALGNFVVELDEYTNLLANKKSRSDRDMEQALGRRMYNIMKGLEGRVAANMVAVNPASWLTNFVPLTQGWASLDSGMLLKGMWDTLKACRTDDGIVGMSSFLTNRRGSDPIVKTWSQSASAVLSSPMEYIDQFTADSLVRGRFQQNLKHGMSEAAAMEEADAWAAGVMADRSKGATPTLFNRSNPLTKLFTQFQLEVNNQLSYMFKDMPREWKDKGLAAACAMIIKLLLGAFLYNEVYEYFIGRRCAFDPLGIVNDTVGDFAGYELPNLVELGMGAAAGDLPSFETEKKDAYGAAAGLAGNIAEELPFIGGVLGGGRVPVSSALPDWENLAKSALNGEWSSEKRMATAVKELSNPLTYLTLPFGGGQIKKIFQGLKAVNEGGSYTVDSQGNDILQYPVFNETAGETLSNYAGALLFGKSTLPTAREWADSGYKSLNAKQTACYQGMTELGVPERDAFELIQAIRAVKAPEGDDIPAEERAAAQKRRLLQQADISAEGKSVVYYGLLASDKERELMDELAAGGADMGEAARVLMELKDAGILEDGKSAAKKEAITESSLSDTEKDSLFQYVLGKDSTGAAWSDTMAEAGLDKNTAAAVANALNGLTPEEGTKTVSDAQKWRAVMDTAKGTADQTAALLVVMSDSARMKFEIAGSFGIEPEAWVQLKEALPQFDANENGSYSGVEIEAAIDALCGDGSLVAPWDKEPLRLSREEKAVLWQLYAGSTSGSGNPYSTRIGKQVAKALEEGR